MAMVDINQLYLFAISILSVFLHTIFMQLQNKLDCVYFHSAIYPDQQSFYN